MTLLTTDEVLRLHALHWLARAALRVARPLRAKALIDVLGRGLRLRGGADIAQAAVHELFPAGSCLSRAMAIASAIPGAEVVIGVQAWEAARLSAHAWLEVEDVPVDTNPGTRLKFPDELARLPAQPMAGDTVQQTHGSVRVNKAKQRHLEGS